MLWWWWCLPACLSVCLSVCIGSMMQCQWSWNSCPGCGVCLSVCLSVCVSACLCVCVSVCVGSMMQCRWSWNSCPGCGVCLSLRVCLCVCLSVCLCLCIGSMMPCRWSWNSCPDCGVCGSLSCSLILSLRTSRHSSHLPRTPLSLHPSPALPRLKVRHFITITEMHHNNMPTGSSLWHFLHRLVHKFIWSVVSSEKEVATTEFVSAETGTSRHVIIMIHFGNFQ